MMNSVLHLAINKGGKEATIVANEREPEEMETKNKNTLEKIIMKQTEQLVELREKVETLRKH